MELLELRRSSPEPRQRLRDATFNTAPAAATKETPIPTSDKPELAKNPENK